MCNVIQFKFTCQHILRRRRSSCKGTKHRVTSTSTKAACTAESFLSLTLRTDCGPCQYETWENNWRLKLERAATFLERLIRKGTPGAREITALVKDLQKEYTLASWDTRHMFARAPRRSLTRVNISEHKKEKSPLLQEVQPEDVVEKNYHREWAEMTKDDYDGNYVASTDPIHPVSTDYSYPMDDDDGSWILNHLSPEEVECPSTDVHVDFNDHIWNWGDNPDEVETSSSTAAWNRTENETWTTSDSRYPKPNKGLIAWGLATPTTPSSAELTLHGLNTTSPDSSALIAQVITMFWQTVNPTPNPNSARIPSAHSPTDRLHHSLEDLESSPSLTPPTTPPPTP